MATETRKEGVENMASSLNLYAKTLGKTGICNRLNNSNWLSIKDAKDTGDKRLSPSLLLDKKVPSLTTLGKALVQQGRLHGDDTTYGIIVLFRCPAYKL